MISKIILLVVSTIVFCSTMFSQIVNDTIDLGEQMLILKLPKFSKKLSVLSFYTEGFFIDYPLSVSNEKPIFSIPQPAVLEIFQGTNLVYDFEKTKYDKLLYDSINPSFALNKKISYVLNGRFYRMDSYKSGLKICYLNVLPIQKKEADKILDSVVIAPILTETGEFIENKKKRKFNFETKEWLKEEIKQ